MIRDMRENPKENPITVKCQGADTLPLDLILEFQGGLKKLSQGNRNKLVKSICRNGFIAPIFLWDDSGDYRIIDGHGRLKALIWMRQAGWDIPLLPVAYINAKDENDAKRKLMAVTSQYGEFDMEELEEWITLLGDDIEETCRLVDEEIKSSIVNGEDYGEEFSLPDGDKEPFQQMTFTLADKQAEYIKEKIIDAKKQIDFDLMDCFGNENGNGNALYCLIKGYVDE